MAKFGNRVKETTDTTGTGTLDLGGAPTGFRGFGDEFTSGNAVAYLIVDDPDNPTSYEFGVGTFTSGTPDTLSRDTVEGSSNGGNKVSWVAGTKTVIATPTAAHLPSKSEKNTFTKLQSWSKGADVASAGALTLGDDGNYFDITGTTAITSIGTKGVGSVVKLHFDGALTLTHQATDLVLPGGANITTAAGDEAEFVEYATGDWRCTSYTKASGQAVVSTTVSAASQAQMEAASATDVYASPGRIQYHPGVAKAWASVTFSGGTPSLAAGYNVSGSITDHGTGDVTLAFTTAFADTTYAVIGSVAQNAAETALRGVTVRNGGKATGSCRLNIGTNTGLEDRNFFVAFFGDQA